MSLVQRSLFELTTSVQSTEQYFNTDSILTAIKGYELALGILGRIGCKNERAFQCIATANDYQDSHVQWLLCYITNLIFLLIYSTCTFESMLLSCCKFWINWVGVHVNTKLLATAVKVCNIGLQLIHVVMHFWVGSRSETCASDFLPITFFVSIRRIN